MLEPKKDTKQQLLLSAYSAHAGCVSRQAMVSECFSCLLLIYGCPGRKPQKVTRFGADPTVKATWRFIRSWICHNHKAYYSYVLLCAFSMYQFWWHMCIGYYRRRNHERSLEFAIQRE